jgi:hypothetical protein
MFGVKTWVTSFPLRQESMHAFVDFCIDVEGCALDQCENDGYVKQWKYVPLNPKGPHPILTWKEMHAEEVMVSLDHDEFLMLLGKVCDFINGIIID